MRFNPPLKRGRLVQRYKRFLADVVLDDGTAVTATCPNTGSMKGLTTPGSIVWLSTSDSPTRKYVHTWEIIEHEIGGQVVPVGINTGHPNRLVTEAIEGGVIGEVGGYASLKREQKYGENSRIDILLECARQGRCYVEIKNVHLMREPGLAEFPDSVTARGAKHLDELARMVEAGHRAVLVFLVQRPDATSFALAGDIDKVYAAAFVRARAAGVEALVYRCDVAPEGISVAERVPFG